MDARRFALYEVYFSCLEDAQRLEVCNKIRRDVMGGFLDGNVPLNVDDNPAVKRLVGDAFAIVQSAFAAPGGVDTLAALDEDVAPVTKATVKILDALERKNVQENVVPLLVSLRVVAAKERCGFLAFQVRQYLMYLKNKCNDEVDQALAPYRDVASEIAFDMGKKSEVQKVRKRLLGNDNEENVEVLPNKASSGIMGKDSTPKVKSKSSRAASDL